ncbi:PilZ domain-containing protein [Litorilituus lipolyticus]|uniref:Flagellar brake protein n=1 Tax=Litorilituus lipolyticus TaxID=2491017 RepID=A0A502L3S0_9GAMM|nr:PilZ domain-containing protein [Litorilituus lipolyticus]TPH18618.1 flagellar brake protein [Litorilituus lipolyticus]
MTEKATKVETATRLSRNLALLNAGSSITIDIATPAGQKNKFRTTFIGYLPKQYVLIQFPDSSKLGNFSQYIKQGTAVTVRGLIEGHEGAIVAFVSVVKQTLQLPSRIMVLDFPHSVSLHHLRSAIRIDTNIIGKVKIDDLYWNTTITNLSISGCHLDVANGEKLVLAEDKDIEIVIESIEGSGNIKLAGNICNLKQLSTGVSFGVKFNSSCKEQVVELLNFALTEAK